jgi:hypothetical protein
MLKLISKKHGKLNKLDKKKIIFLKNTHWNYRFSEHAQYLKDNFKKNDFHNLFFYQNKLIGYTAFRNQYLIYKNKKYKYLHFDCLVILEKYRNKKLSKLLMNFNEYTIMKNSLPSILFCEKNLINFYKKFNWVTNYNKAIKLNLKKKSAKKIMTFDFKF